MSLLAGILGSQYQDRNEINNSEFARAEGEQALGHALNAAAAIDEASKRLDNLMGAAITIAALNPTSEDGIKMSRIHLAEAMAACDLSEEDAVSATAGLESDSVDVGLEAWSSIKDFVKSIIEWIQKQWKKFKRFVMQYWNKFFGDSERLLKSWTKVLEEAKTKQTGYTLEKNAKGDFEKTADYFYGKDKNPKAVLTGDDLVEAANNYYALAEIIRNKVLDTEFVELTDSEILGDAGTLKSESELRKALAQPEFFTFGAAFGKLVSRPIVATADRAPKAKYASAVTGALAGGVNLILCGSVGAKVEYKDNILSMSDPERLKKMDMVVGSLLASDSKAKSKTKKVTVKFVDAATIEEIADANIELLTEIVGIQRSKRMTKVMDDFDKASKNLDSWKKKVPDDKDQPQARTDYRTAVKIATELFSAQRRVKVNGPLQFCQAARLASAAHYDYATRCLSSLKKDK